MLNGYDAIVHATVREVLPPSSQTLALAAWEDQSIDPARQPSLRELSRQLCAAAGHTELADRFYAVLLRRFFAQQRAHASPAVEAIKPMPSRQTEASADAAAQPPLFAVMVRSFLAQLHPDGRNGNDTLAGALARAIPDRDRRLTLERWLVRGDAANAPVCGLEQQRAIMHGLYVQACEDVGPVAADNALAHALRQVRADPRAAREPPERWL